MPILFSLLGVHALCDYALQSDTMSREKNRRSTTPLQTSVPWYYWLTAHTLVHGLAVQLITHNLTLGLAEAAAHWLIDFGKCEKKYGIAVDQGLHVVCKIVWCWILMKGYMR